MRQTQNEMLSWTCVVRGHSLRAETSVCSFLGLFLPARVFGMPQLRAVFLLLWRDLGRRLASRHGIASHGIFESGRREDESQADRFGANVLQTHPGIRRNEHQSPRVEIALLIAEPDMGRSAVDQHDFILGQVPVLLYGCSLGKLLRACHQMLRAVVFGPTLSMNWEEAGTLASV